MNIKFNSLWFVYRFASRLFIHSTTLVFDRNPSNDILFSGYSFDRSEPFLARCCLVLCWTRLASSRGALVARGGHVTSIQTASFLETLSYWFYY